jgi:chromosome segregation ATPase
MTDIAINHDLLATKEQLYDEHNTKIDNIKKTMSDLVKTRNEFKTTLTQALSDTTKSKNFINKLKKKISKLDTQIKEKETVISEMFYENQDMYHEIQHIKSALKIPCDYDFENEDEDDDPTLFGYEVRGIEEFCNNPDIIDKLMRILDPAVLERIMKDN